MKKAHSGKGKTPHLVWVVSGELGRVLFATTTLETTRALRKMGWKITLLVMAWVRAAKANRLGLWAEVLRRETWGLPRAPVCW